MTNRLQSRAEDAKPAGEGPIGTALVTGGSRGIGRAIAIRLAEDGYDVALNYLSRSDDALQSAAEVRKRSRNCWLLPFDVSSFGQAAAKLRPFLHGQTLKVCVCNAGIVRDCSLMFMKAHDWHDVLNVNLNGFWNTLKLVLPAMIRAGGGRIVVISSVAAEIGWPGQTAYSAAKAGLIGATRSLAKEVAAHNILINAVVPGMIDTERSANISCEKVRHRCLLGRKGTVDEVAGAVSFLCGKDATYITGQTICVDGGVSL